eukprot:9488440-Pyramimonas_sp.AAC.1
MFACIPTYTNTPVGSRSSGGPCSTPSWPTLASGQASLFSWGHRRVLHHVDDTTYITPGCITQVLETHGLGYTLEDARSRPQPVPPLSAVRLERFQDAEMTPKKERHPDSSGDGQLTALEQAIVDALPTSALVPYREEMCGSRDTDVIQQYKSVLLLMGGINSPTAIAAFKRAGLHNDSKWKLGRELQGWAEKQAKRARAARRDVDQAMLKYNEARKKDESKEPQDWLMPFWRAAQEQSTDTAPTDLVYNHRFKADEMVAYREMQGTDACPIAEPSLH